MGLSLTVTGAYFTVGFVSGPGWATIRIANANAATSSTEPTARYMALSRGRDAPMGVAFVK